MLELHIALRFLREGKIQTILILTGICVGIAVQVFLSALITGLQKDLIYRTVGTSTHITAQSKNDNPVSLLSDSIPVISVLSLSGMAEWPIQGYEPVLEQLRNTNLLSVVSPVLDGSGFVFKGEKSLPVLIRGVNFKDADPMYRISKRMISGTTSIGADGILIGKELAEELRINVGQTVRIATSEGISDNFTIRGIFDLEVKTINEAWVIMDLSRSQAFLNHRGSITSIETQVKQVFEAFKIKERLKSSFPHLSWISWQETNANLLVALRSQSSSSNMIQVLVLLAVTLGISSVLAVSALQKAKQIGILKAIGAATYSVRRIFLIQGAILGFLGSVAGCISGYFLIKVFLIATAGPGGKPLFPLVIEPLLFQVSILIAVVAGTIAAALPAHRSARLNPIEVIRNG